MRVCSDGDVDCFCVGVVVCCCGGVVFDLVFLRRVDVV